MNELYEMNLMDMLTPEMFKRNVRLASNPWKATNPGQLNVVLECTKRVQERLSATGVYIKWFRFMVRTRDAVMSCYRCMSFDHVLRNCRLRENVCRRCGAAGHFAAECPNPLRCRNCYFKGWPSDHLMMSAACPVYAARIARAHARH